MFGKIPQDSRAKIEKILEQDQRKLLNSNPRRLLCEIPTNSWDFRDYQGRIPRNTCIPRNSWVEFQKILGQNLRRFLIISTILGKIPEDCWTQLQRVLGRIPLNFWAKSWGTLEWNLKGLLSSFSRGSNRTPEYLRNLAEISGNFWPIPSVSVLQIIHGENNRGNSRDLLGRILGYSLWVSWEK